MILIKVNAFDAYARVAKVNEGDDLSKVKFSLVDVQNVPEKIAATKEKHILISTDFLNLGQDLKKKIQEQSYTKYKNNNIKVEVERI